MNALCALTKKQKIKFRIWYSRGNCTAIYAPNARISSVVYLILILVFVPKRNEIASVSTFFSVSYKIRALFAIEYHISCRILCAMQCAMKHTQFYEWNPTTDKPSQASLSKWHCVFTFLHQLRDGERQKEQERESHWQPNATREVEEFNVN